MQNYIRFITQEDTITNLEREICDEIGILPDEPFAFSGIAQPVTVDDVECYKLQINMLDEHIRNPYSLREILHMLLSTEDYIAKTIYVNAPLDLWLDEFQPLLLSLVARAGQKYKALEYSEGELLSLLYKCILNLYRRNYYLSKPIIKRSFYNALNIECRRLKEKLITDSLDAPVKDCIDRDATLLDLIADTSDEEAEMAERDHKLFEKIKAVMLTDISEFEFDRIMRQLESKTIDRRTAYILGKYRKIFAPTNIPRPNARKGVNK